MTINQQVQYWQCEAMRWRVLAIAATVACIGLIVALAMGGRAQ